MAVLSVRPLLVGELNPLGSRPEYALWPAPVNSAGWRLCYRILELTPLEYLRRFARINLCVGRWDLGAARAMARSLTDGGVKVLLGKKVCQAFRLPYAPFAVLEEGRYVVLPHPSGLCRTWNEPAAAGMARHVLKDYLRREE